MVLEVNLVVLIRDRMDIKNPDPSSCWIGLVETDRTIVAASPQVEEVVVVEEADQVAKLVVLGKAHADRGA